MTRSLIVLAAFVVAAVALPALKRDLTPQLDTGTPLGMIKALMSPAAPDSASASATATEMASMPTFTDGPFNPEQFASMMPQPPQFGEREQPMPEDTPVAVATQVPGDEGTPTLPGPIDPTDVAPAPLDPTTVVAQPPFGITTTATSVRLAPSPTQAEMTLGNTAAQVEPSALSEPALSGIAAPTGVPVPETSAPLDPAASGLPAVSASQPTQIGAPAMGTPAPIDPAAVGTPAPLDAAQPTQVNMPPTGTEAFEPTTTAVGATPVPLDPAPVGTPPAPVDPSAVLVRALGSVPVVGAPTGGPPQLGVPPLGTPAPLGSAAAGLPAVSGAPATPVQGTPALDAMPPVEKPPMGVVPAAAATLVRRQVPGLGALAPGLPLPKLPL